MSQELYDMLENQLLAMDRLPPISLEAAEKLWDNKRIELESVEDVKTKLIKPRGDYQSQMMNLRNVTVEDQVTMIIKIKKQQNIDTFGIFFSQNIISKTLFKQTSRLLSNQFCLRYCYFYFGSHKTQEVNKLYDLLKNLPQEVQDLWLEFSYCQILNDNGFQGVAKALAKSKGLKKLELNTSGTDKKKLTGDHIDMVSDVLPDLEKLEHFNFIHGFFPNTRKMEEILVKDLGMKPAWNNDYLNTMYQKQ